MSECIPCDPPVYKLVDYDREAIHRSFYEAELQKVKTGKDSVYHVEKILERSTVRGEKQAVVKWKIWPEKFNSWDSVSNLKDI